MIYEVDDRAHRVIIIRVRHRSEAYDPAVDVLRGPSGNPDQPRAAVSGPAFTNWSPFLNAARHAPADVQPACSFASRSAIHILSNV